MKSTKKILIIDDEIDIGEVLVEILSPLYEVVEYHSEPESAKLKIKEKHYDLILSDISMPKIPGPELIKYVRGLGQLMPVIFVTGYADKDTVLSALRLGVSDIIEKPFDTKNLVVTIDRVLELEKRKDQLYYDRHVSKMNNEQLNKQEKMIGLLQVAKEVKRNS